MFIHDLHLFQDKLYFTAADVSDALGIKMASAYVLCHRYTAKGLFIRLKKDFYVLEANWKRYGERDFFRLANHLQTPSYVSLGSALSFHGVTTQVQKNWIESVALRRTIQFQASGTAFHYFKINRSLYSGFEKQADMFLAKKEKAFSDACHLSAYGNYALDWSACDFSRLDRDVLSGMMKPFPERTVRFIRNVLAR